MSIGDRLRAFREAKKLSQGDIEQRTGLFRSYGTGVRRVGVKSLVFFLLFLPVVPSKSGDEPRPTNEQKGTQIILQARAAVCDPSVLAGLRPTSVDSAVHPPQWMLDRTGTTQQAQSRSLHLDFLLPDRFKAVLTARMNSSRSIWITAWNGGEPWSDMITPDARATINKVFEPGAEAYDKDLNFRRHVYAEFVRDLMMWLLIAPDLSSFHYTYAGVHRTPTGTTEMVDVTGPNDTGMRLFIDQGSHQLLMIHHTGLAHYTAVMLPAPVSGLPPRSRSGSGGGIPKIGLDSTARTLSFTTELQELNVEEVYGGPMGRNSSSAVMGSRDKIHSSTDNHGDFRCSPTPQRAHYEKYWRVARPMYVLVTVHWRQLASKIARVLLPIGHHGLRAPAQFGSQRLSMRNVLETDFLKAGEALEAIGVDCGAGSDVLSDEAVDRRCTEVRNDLPCGCAPSFFPASLRLPERGWLGAP